MSRHLDRPYFWWCVRAYVCPSGSIVIGWLEREEKLGMSVGSVWHLLSSDWWIGWLKYVSSQGSGNAVHPSTSELSVRKGSSRRTPSIDSTLATDSDKSVIGTSYQHLGDAPQNVHVVPLDSQSSSRKSSNASSSSIGNNSGGMFNGGSGFQPQPSRPGVINNSVLIQTVSTRVTSLTGEGGKLCSTARRDRDFQVIPERLWKALVQWYGGGPALPRQVIRNHNGKIELELNPLSLKLLKHQPPVTRPLTTPTTASMVAGNMPSSLAITPVTIPVSVRRYHAYQAAFSRRTTVKQVADFLCNKLHIKAEDLRLWHFRDDSHMELLDYDLISSDTYTSAMPKMKSLEDFGFQDDDSLLIEIRSRDGTWPEEITSLYSNNDRRLSLLNVSNSGIPPGIIGLSNLGNTCYMNSSLQCMSSTRILSEYFCKECHLFELNRTNPLGMKGHVAKRFGDLLRDMHSGQVYITVASKSLLLW